MAGDDLCIVRTKGRSTGREHEIQIWFARRADTLYLLAGGGRSADWVRNLEANPVASVSLDGAWFAATGRVLDGRADAAEAETARALVFDKYQPRYDGSLEEWRVRALPVAIDLHGPSDDVDEGAA